jgi:DNA mismatch repair protein MutH
MKARARPPADLHELEARARSIEGVAVAAIAQALGEDAPRTGLRTKGKLGDLVERFLGATGGSRAVLDFPAIGVELKTVPVDLDGRPRESTYVCRIDLAEAEIAEWATAWVKRKLAHVLFVPLVDPKGASPRIGRTRFWRPSPEQEAILRADFEDLMGTIGAGRIEDLTAREGIALQIRPKAKDGTRSALVFDRDGEPIATVPRGFYLRARFVEEILRG